MFYQIDARLESFSSNLWRLGRAKHDPNVQNAIVGKAGEIVCHSVPLIGPEMEEERFESINWHSAKPSRWFQDPDLNILVSISLEGKLFGEIGFRYRPETEDELSRLRGNNATR